MTSGEHSEICVARSYLGSTAGGYTAETNRSAGDAGDVNTCVDANGTRDDELPGVTTPVFVDLTGRRRRALRVVGAVAGLVCAAYPVTAGLGLLGVPIRPQGLLPAAIAAALGRDTGDGVTVPNTNRSPSDTRGNHGQQATDTAAARSHSELALDAAGPSSLARAAEGAAGNRSNVSPEGMGLPSTAPLPPPPPTQPEPTPSAPPSTDPGTPTVQPTNPAPTATSPGRRGRSRPGRHNPFRGQPTRPHMNGAADPGRVWHSHTSGQDVPADRDTDLVGANAPRHSLSASMVDDLATPSNSTDE